MDRWASLLRPKKRARSIHKVKRTFFDAVPLEISAEIACWVLRRGKPWAWSTLTMLRAGGTFAQGASLMFNNWKDVSSEKKAICIDGDKGFVLSTHGAFDAVWLPHIAQIVGHKVTSLTIGRRERDIVQMYSNITEKHFINIKKLVLRIPFIDGRILMDLLLACGPSFEELDIAVETVQNETIETIAMCIEFIERLRIEIYYACYTEEIGLNVCHENSLTVLWEYVEYGESLLYYVKLVYPKSACNCVLDLDGATEAADVFVEVEYV